MRSHDHDDHAAVMSDETVTLTCEVCGGDVGHDETGTLIHVTWEWAHGEEDES